MTMGWTEKRFEAALKRSVQLECEIDPNKGDLAGLRSFLKDKKTFLLALLANPNMLEHDEFTDCLWAVFHLGEELEHRKSLGDLPEADLEHLSGDIERAYDQLIKEWIAYMEHLKERYPSLYSLNVRINPFNPASVPEIL